jgi:hypothetical protein
MNSHQSRPAVSHEAAKSFGGDTTDSSRVHRRYWAQQLLDAGTGWPVYGSPEWCALQVDDPRRIAACVAAAEIYTRDWYDNLEERLRTEVQHASLAYKRDEDAEYARQHREHRAYWSRRAGKVVVMSFEERRRQQLIEASQPRPGDYMGRNGGAS